MYDGYPIYYYNDRTGEVIRSVLSEEYVRNHQNVFGMFHFFHTTHEV